MGATVGLVPRAFELPSNIVLTSLQTHLFSHTTMAFLFFAAGSISSHVVWKELHFYHFFPMGPDHESYIWTGHTDQHTSQKSRTCSSMK